MGAHCWPAISKNVVPSMASAYGAYTTGTPPPKDIAAGPIGGTSRPLAMIRGPSGHDNAVRLEGVNVMAARDASQTLGWSTEQHAH